MRSSGLMGHSLFKRAPCTNRSFRRRFRATSHQQGNSLRNIGVSLIGTGKKPPIIKLYEGRHIDSPIIVIQAEGVELSYETKVGAEVLQEDGKLF